MKLKVKQFNDRCICLTDEHGVPLPCQRDVTLVTGHDDVAEVTVTFLVDTRFVVLELGDRVGK